MPDRNQSPLLLAGGNVSPSTFIKVSTAADNTGLQAGANEAIIGISGVGTKQPPGVDGVDAYHAHSGEAIELFGMGDICLLKAGTGGWTRGSKLKSDANGAGVALGSGVSQNIGAIALENAAAGEYGRVQILIMNAFSDFAGASAALTDITGTDSSLGIAGQSGSSGSAGGAVPITGGAGDTNGAGGAVSATGGGGAGTGAGGAASIAGGTSGNGATGNGGAASVTGGAATSTNGTGGAASLIGGLGTGTGAGGAITITSGAAGATGVAGAVNISVGAATAGNGSSVTITGGNGAGGTNAGGHVNIVPGTAVSTGTPGEFRVNGTADLLYHTEPLTATDVTRAVFVATRAMILKSVKAFFSTASSSGTLQVEKLTGTTAAGSGTNLLTGTVSLAGTANTVVSGTLISTIASLTFAAGDRLGVVIAGTMTSLANCKVTVALAPL